MFYIKDLTLKNPITKIYDRERNYLFYDSAAKAFLVFEKQYIFLLPLTKIEQNIPSKVDITNFDFNNLENSFVHLSYQFQCIFIVNEKYLLYIKYSSKKVGQIQRIEVLYDFRKNQQTLSKIIMISPIQNCYAYNFLVANQEKIYMFKIKAKQKGLKISTPKKKSFGIILNCIFSYEYNFLGIVFKDDQQILRIFKINDAFDFFKIRKIRLTNSEKLYYLDQSFNKCLNDQLEICQENFEKFRIKFVKMWDNLFVVEINIEVGQVTLYYVEEEKFFEFQIPNEGNITSTNEFY